ncbi:O-antigen ligase family protein [Occultella kanbiaonis]|uniref:O-antigen ligase family protein n=1 Tax=Occultella kanbiaonis TaxID=2675754 RepID=UPI0012B802C7|nr:O-antigen ligase family protein [Occultella kanbiaonis]
MPAVLPDRIGAEEGAPTTVSQNALREWRPTLLRVPDGYRRVRDHWIPALVHRWTLTNLGLLALFLCLQFLIPARLVIGGLGAVGRPSVAIGVMLAFLWALSAIRPHHLPAGRQPIRWLMALFVGLQLLGNVIGFDRLPSAAEASSADRWLIFTVSIVGVTLVVADGIRTRRDLDRLLRLVILLAAIMSIIGMLQFAQIIDVTQYINIPGLRANSELIGVGERGDGNFPRVASTANHYIEFGVVLALVLPIALHYALFSPPGRTRAWRWVAVGVVAFGIPLSISRSAILTVAVTLGLLAVVWPWRQRYNALVIGILSLAVFHLVNRGVLGTIRALFTNAENDSSVTDRIARTGYVLDLWSLRPWFGRGAGMVTPEEYILLDNQVYVTLLAGGVIGVVGLALFFLVPYFMGRSLRLRGSNQETRHLGQSLAVAMPAALMASATFDSFSFATFVGVICIIIGAIGALWRLDDASPTNEIQLADPADKFVGTPIGANFRERFVALWIAARPRNYGRFSRPAQVAEPGETPVGGVDEPSARVVVESRGRAAVSRARHAR